MNLLILGLTVGVVLLLCQYLCLSLTQQPHTASLLCWPLKNKKYTHFNPNVTSWDKINHMLQLFSYGVKYTSFSGTSSALN